MSGQQIGTVIGAVVGAYFGGPTGAQFGAAIGGYLGGAIAPTQINGPKIGDGQQQTSTDGSVIAWVFGTAAIAGCIVQLGPRTQKKVKDSGKGSGTVTHHYEAHQTFVIMICESSDIRGSAMSNVTMVTQDGKLVYDVRPGSTMLEDSYKWAANVDFMYGREDQLPHPTLEAITGVGNQVAYRGSLIAVFRDFNLTNSSNRIPSFGFTVSSSGSSDVDIKYSDAFKYAFNTSVEADYSGVDFDDSGWDVGAGGFGNGGPAASGAGQTVGSTFPAPYQGRIMWIRRTVNATPGKDVNILAVHDNSAKVWWNGVNILDQPDTDNTVGNSNLIVSGVDVLSVNTVAMRVHEYDPAGPVNYSYISLQLTQEGTPAGATTLGQIMSALCERGGLNPDDFDTTPFNGINVIGYPVARTATASDCLGPLMAAFFAYASEYDGKLNFQPYGQNTVMTIDEDDLVMGNDANDGYITKNLRNQETEFPKRIIATYLDPAQNYFTCNVPATRIAIDITAIGDQGFSIPLVMPADQAQQAVDKALKVTYATLEGTLEYSVPYGGFANYLQLCVGESIAFLNKRWVVDEMIVSDGYLKLTTRYDRQSAYTSNVQAVVGNPPLPPTSPYSGPTQLIAMNLPSLRPQDTYGAYLAGASATNSPSWQGCTVQVSYDGQVTWANATTITDKSTLGTIAVNEPSGGVPVGEPLTVQVNDELTTITADQLAAQGNAFAVINAAGVAEIGQFQTATEQTSVDEYQLTGVLRGLNGTTREPRLAGEAFTMLDSVTFFPIDTAYKGKTIYFRCVGIGEATPDPAISFVYNPDMTIIYDGGQTGT